MNKKNITKIIINISKNMDIQPVRTIDLEKNELRQITVPNKQGYKQKKIYKHLKITAKNKDIDKIMSPSPTNNKQSNYSNILLSNNLDYNDINYSINNYRLNKINQIISNSNLNIINNHNNNENLNKTPKSKYKNGSWMSFETDIIKDEKFKENQEYKISNKNVNLNPYNVNRQLNNINYNINKGIKVVNPQFNVNKVIRPNNSFNDASNILFLSGKNTVPRNRALNTNNLKNYIINTMNKKALSSSLNVKINRLKQNNNQELLSGLVIFPENEFMRKTNNNGIFNNKYEFNEIEIEKIDIKKMIKDKCEQEKNLLNKKKNNLYQYLILKGNASYLVKYCMAHRVNWIPIENPPENCNSFNFKWKELSYGIDYNSLNRNPGTKQIVNHFENHYVISNKANMFINLMKYCEQRKISVFKYVPFTIVFKIKDRRKIKNKDKQSKWLEKLEKLKDFIQNIEKSVKNYNEIGKFYSDEEYIKDKEKRNEFERIQMVKMNRRKKAKELEENSDNEKSKEKNKTDKKEMDKEIKIKEEKYNGKFKVYSDIFQRLKITDKLPTRYKTGEEKEKDKVNDRTIGNNTLIEVPSTHYKGKNMWVLKAVNLNRGMCIKVVNSFEQMEKVINRFKNGVDYRFTVEEIEEEKHQENNISEEETTKSESIPKSPNTNNNCELIEQKEKEKVKEEDNKKEKIKSNENKNKNENNNDNKKGKEEEKEEKIYNCTKILIQKYIENPLLYKGRKCDIRIWVLLTHQMKVFLFKEGHLKTCSVEYDLDSNNAFTHITNYSFQKYNSNFQKFEKGNEVPFYEFQKFIDKEYPEKNYKLKKDLMKQIKEIISLTMRSGKDKINKNGRSHQFEIFGYDFMLDRDFNVFLIEINTNPGLEISSPWIQIVVPRMLDDALRLTVDKVFEPIYDFNKNYKGNYTEEQKKLLNDSKINFDFNAVDFHMSKKSSELSSSMNVNTPPQQGANKKNILNINLELDESDKKIIKENIGDKQIQIQNKQENEVNQDNNNNKNKIIQENKENKSIKNNNNKEKDKRGNIKQIKEEKNKKYISPFPVPGYSLDENLWEFVCDLNTKDPFEINNEKETINNKDREIYTGIRHLLKKKEKRNKAEKGVSKKTNKGKKSKNKKSNK